MVEMTESNKYGGVMTDEIWNLPLGFGASPWVRIPCLVHGSSQIYSFHTQTHLTIKKQRTKKWHSTPEKFYPIALVYVQENPGLEEADLGPSLDS